MYEPKPNSVVPQKVLNYMMKISVLFTSLLLSGTKTYAYGVGSCVAGDFVVKSFVQQNFIVCHEEMKTEAWIEWKYHSLSICVSFESLLDHDRFKLS